MRKLTRKSLDELAEVMPIISEFVQCTYIGGGDGTLNNPYTYMEHQNMIMSQSFEGGYVEIEGLTSYFFPTGSSSSGSSSGSSDSPSSSSSPTGSIPPGSPDIGGFMNDLANSPSGTINLGDYGLNFSTGKTLKDFSAQINGKTINIKSIHFGNVGDHPNVFSGSASHPKNVNDDDPSYGVRYTISVQNSTTGLPMQSIWIVIDESSVADFDSIF